MFRGFAVFALVTCCVLCAFGLSVQDGEQCSGLHLTSLRQYSNWNYNVHTRKFNVGRLMDPCLAASLFSKAVTFTHSVYQGIPSVWLKPCNYSRYYGPCDKRVYRCLREFSFKYSRISATSAIEDTLCWTIGGGALFHDFFFLPYLVAVRNQCTAYTVETHYPYMAFLYRTLLPGKETTLDRNVTYRRVLPQFHPGNVNFNYVYPPWPLETIRVEVLQRLELSLYPRSVPPIFMVVNRNASSGGGVHDRRLFLPAEIKAHVSTRYGMEYVEFVPDSSTPLLTQLRAWSTADVILSPHGSSLTSLVFAKATACVLEAYPDGIFNSLYMMLALSRGLCHVGLLTPSARGLKDCLGSRKCVRERIQNTSRLHMSQVIGGLTACKACQSKVEDCRSNYRQVAQRFNDSLLRFNAVRVVATEAARPQDWDGVVAFLQYLSPGSLAARLVEQPPPDERSRSRQVRGFINVALGVHGPAFRRFVERGVFHCIIDVYAFPHVGAGGSLDAMAARTACYFPVFSMRGMHSLVVEEAQLFAAYTYCDLCTGAMQISKYSGFGPAKIGRR
eukprot:NODE_889_length_1844_cov_37.564345_g787_i0.p1 GENE.NODE_889_length_1844_cov_37.564345_g787_i0~~NODE_889_length_1844_cov_37.564345_g787_i0.p1  ORF type:complete len:559 (-),score=70.33 NODE_889_length_1844_cov_37.564345_g787_i0:91-1767(-)